METCFPATAFPLCQLVASSLKVLMCPCLCPAEQYRAIAGAQQGEVEGARGAYREATELRFKAASVVS